MQEPNGDFISVDQQKRTKTDFTVGQKVDAPQFLQKMVDDAQNSVSGLTNEPVHTLQNFRENAKAPNAPKAIRDLVTEE